MTINNKKPYNKGKTLLSRLLTTVSAIVLMACSANTSRLTQTLAPEPSEPQKPKVTMNELLPFLQNISFLKKIHPVWNNYVEVIPPESEAAVEKISLDFNSRSKMPITPYITKSSVRLVQIETKNTKEAAEISTSGSISFPRTYHGESATDITETTAENIANTEIQTRLIDAEYLFNMPSLTVQYLTRTSDIMSFSYTPRQHRKMTLDRLSTYIDVTSRAQNPDTRASIRDMYGRSSVITLAAAGNETYRNQSTLQWESEFIVNFNDTHLVVGATSRTKDGHVSVAEYSSSSAPTVLSVNPYEYGFNYDYYRDRSEVEAIIDRDIDKVSEVPSLRSCKTDNKESAWAKIIEEYSGEFYSQIITSEERQAIRDAIKQCFLSAYDSKVKETHHGTSFSTPHLAGLAGGVLAKMRDKYGENALTPDELVAAIILSAQPVWETEKTNKKDIPYSLEYVTTPAGLLFNDNIAGFGYVDYAELEKVAEEIARSSAENPSLKPTQMSTTVTSPTYVDEITTDGMKRYKLPVTEDFVITRIMLELEFAGNPLNRTDIIYLQAPTGEKFRIPLTREQNTDKLIFGFTNGMYGSATQGEWAILIPGDTESITAASVTFHGVNKGSSIEQAVHQKAAVQKAENQDPRVLPQRFNPMRFKIS